MRPDEADAMIEKLLAEPEGYIPDNGFTARVMGVLPAPALSPAVRLAILTAFVALGLAVVCFVTPAGAAVIRAVLVAAGNATSLHMPPVWSLAVLATVVLGLVGLTRLGREVG